MTNFFVLNLFLELTSELMLGCFVLFLQMVLIFGVYPKKQFRDNRLVKAKWLGSKALHRYISLFVFLYDHKRFEKYHLKMLYHVTGSIIEMWEKSGITFTIKYWSEVLRLVVQFLNTKGTWHWERSTWVAIHKNGGRRSRNTFYGLPKKLPTSWKVFLLSFRSALWKGNLSRRDLVLFKLMVSVLSFFRATSPRYSRPKFETITDPFNGVQETLPLSEIRQALTDLGIKKLVVKKPTIFFFSKKSGPNFPIATLGLGLDLIAWILSPNKWGQYFLMCLTHRYWSVLIWFVLMSIVSIPFLIPIYLYDSKFYLGRIAILDEARGKKRLIGITDFWTQILFKPLHDAIYQQLDRLPADGTRDQQKPIRRVLQLLGIHSLSDLKGRRVQSLDLSAATDRLPIKLQVQILNELGYPGEMWSSLLDREWSSESGPLRYSVGQPMGAYSSFAMLALTHHVIVNIAARRSGINPKGLLYAVLGDDGFIAHSGVASKYKDIFRYLGMTINPIKGFEGTVLEFAKQLWSINRVNLSPIGAKNALLCISHPEFLPSILFELFTKGFPMFINKRIGNSNVGRREEGGMWQIPLVSSDSVWTLVTALFGGKSIRSKERVWIYILMAIGPVSGLWSLPHVHTKHLVGAGIYHFFKRMFLKSVHNWLNPTYDHNSRTRASVKYLRNLKTTLGEDRVVITDKLVRAWRDFLAAMSINLMVVPYVGFEEKRGLKPSIFSQALISYSLIVSPILPILIRDSCLKFWKVIRGCWAFVWMKVLRGLIYYNHFGLLTEGAIATVLLLLLTRFDILFVIWPSTYLFVCHWIVTSNKIKIWVYAQVYFSPIYGFPGSNVIYDYLSRPFDPFGEEVTTLSIISDNLSQGSDAAFRQIISSLWSYKQIRDFYNFENRAKDRGMRCIAKTKKRPPKLELID